jgi:hypothetical protein
MGPLSQDMVRSDFHHPSDVECLENTHILSSASALLISENTFSAMFVVMTSCLDIQVESREGGG